MLAVVTPAPAPAAPAPAVAAAEGEFEGVVVRTKLLLLVDERRDRPRALTTLSCATWLNSGQFAELCSEWCRARGAAFPREDTLAPNPPAPDAPAASTASALAATLAGAPAAAVDATPATPESGTSLVSAGTSPSTTPDPACPIPGLVPGMAARANMELCKEACRTRPARDGRWTCMCVCCCCCCCCCC